VLLSWLKRRRRRKLLAQPLEPTWRGHLDQVRLSNELSPQDRQRLENDARVIVAEKHWEGCGGLELTDEIRILIAAQAALLLLNLDHDYFRGVRSILVYPTTFLVPEGTLSRGGLVRDGSQPVLGLASMQGPVILAWDSVRSGNDNAEDGRNVVLHEFAHKLDMLDRFADGAPPLANRAQYEAWSRIMSEEFQDLTDSVAHGRRTLLDKYGATNPAEFYAVATELFFEKPRQMQKRHPELYELLGDYYRQDPARRAG
jgi:Mlc titration factor MtfA (ptsG expression regulator)